MPDREKVIRGLECCYSLFVCPECPYYGTGEECDRDQLMLDALALLREQEPVKPISAHVWPRTFGRCGNCKAPLPALEGLRSKFCWMCGKAVKWDVERSPEPPG